MQQVQGMIFRGIVGIATASFVAVTVLSAAGAEPPSESQLQRLMETAAQAPESPDHEYLTNSLQAGIKAFREARDVLRPEQYSNWRQSHAAEQIERSTVHEERGCRPHCSSLS